MWSAEVLPLAKTRSLCEATAEKSYVLKERTNEKTAETQKRRGFGSFRKIGMEVEGLGGGEEECGGIIEPKVLFSS
jgi:hypothetical protein